MSASQNNKMPTFCTKSWWYNGKSSANILVGTGFTSQYPLQAKAIFLKAQLVGNKVITPHSLTKLLTNNPDSKDVCPG